MSKQYAIKVPFENGWLFVTKGKFSELEVETYDDLGLACDARNLWGPRAQVVEYNEEYEKTG